MGRTEYILKKDISEIRHYLTHVKEMSEPGLDFYSYNFPVISYKKRTLIECRLMFNTQNKDVLCDLWDVNNNCLYMGMTTEYGNWEAMRKKIEIKMNREFRKLGVVKNDKRKNKQ